MNSRILTLLSTAALVLVVSTTSMAQQASPSTSTPSSASTAQDNEALKAAEQALDRLKYAEAKNGLLEERLQAKDDRIAAKDREIELLKQQLALAKSIDRDRTAIATGDDRLFGFCETQLATAQAEIHRLRNPGFFRSIFNTDTLKGGVVGFGIGKLSR